MTLTAHSGSAVAVGGGGAAIALIVYYCVLLEMDDSFKLQSTADYRRHVFLLLLALTVPLSQDS